MHICDGMTQDNNPNVHELLHLHSNLAHSSLEWPPHTLPSASDMFRSPINLSHILTSVLAALTFVSLAGALRARRVAGGARCFSLVISPERDWLSGHDFGNQSINL